MLCVDDTRLSLRDELEVACRDVDDEALCDLAQRMQELTEALEIAHANEAQMQAELVSDLCIQ